MKKAMINFIQNPKNDELYTPEYAIKPLIKYLPKDVVIWECTDWGCSNITKTLRKNGYKVISTKKDEIDFLDGKVTFDFDVIVTNPPYSQKDKFIEKCYAYGKPFALLLPITSLEGIQRGKMFRNKGIELMVFDKRINYMEEKKSCWFNTSWFCYKLLPSQLIFEELRK